jgi:hypothetical protein
MIVLCPCLHGCELSFVSLFAWMWINVKRDILCTEWAINCTAHLKHFPCRKIKYVYLSVPVAAPAFWHIVDYIHDNTYQLCVTKHWDIWSSNINFTQVLQLLFFYLGMCSLSPCLMNNLVVWCPVYCIHEALTSDFMHLTYSSIQFIKRLYQQTRLSYGSLQNSLCVCVCVCARARVRACARARAREWASEWRREWASKRACTILDLHGTQTWRSGQGKESYAIWVALTTIWKWCWHCKPTEDAWIHLRGYVNIQL